jgi:hypothetical protein
MTAVTSFAKISVLGAALLAIAACAPVSRPEGVTAADVPPGASRFATETKIEIIETFSDATDKADPAEIENYKAIALAALTGKLAAEKLEIVAANAEAPLKMRLELQIRRWEPITGGGTFVKAIVSNAAGKELFSTQAGEGLHLLANGLDSKIALRSSMERLGGGILDGLKPLRAPAS